MGGNQNENKSSVYDESKIKTLSSLEHIRLRTGMYIGRLGDGTNQNDGIYILLKEVVDNVYNQIEKILKEWYGPNCLKKWNGKKQLL